ncbi:MAG TPA: immunoglobulin domain-containing protein [Opitutaceae bacterium]|nr:immunoglobulin domain-containing protein [Opitutaceae bacterium]
MPGTPRTRARLALLLALAAFSAPAARASDEPAQDGRRRQDIAFAEIPAHSAADAPFAVPATATSGLPVELRIISGPAVLDQGKFRLTGEPGLVIVRASQPGNAAFQPARDAERAFTVRPRPSAPAFTSQPAAADATVGGPILMSVEVSGEPAPSLQWRKDGSPIDGATGRALEIAQAAASDAGSYDVTASNPSGTAASQRVTVMVGRRSQFVSFQAPGGPLVAGQPVTLSASASSGLPVRFEVSSGPGFLTGATLTAQAGAVVVRAVQPGDSGYDAASPVTQTLIFSPAPGR